ncbi:protein-L-isoaspartate O-methyltransferase [Kitasatospora sp. NPDC092948]|uniref:protein-L-isoaspartate O-methyltransferase family protein n=1 Tax=Kitasatospora sp. NPDC092948 TaxID=3364088 RepID=UPI0037F704FF
MTVADVAARVPERHYTHHDGRGVTPNRSNPAVIHRDLAALDVRGGMNVAEVGTGSGYSGALLAELVGPSGTVTSLDIDPYLVRWGNLIHQQRGLQHVRCHVADGTAGFPARAPYDRMVAWCTPPLLPQAWVDQIVDGGLIVAPLPIADVPHMTVVATIRVTGGEPVVETVSTGGYIEATGAPKTDPDVPGRWVDWENRIPAPAWISIAWREHDDDLHTGARATLARLLTDAHTEPYDGAELDWPSWQTYVAAQNDPHLTVAGLNPDVLAIGHSTATTAAVLRHDGTILADRPDSPSLAVLHNWLTAWEAAGRPAPEAHTPALARGVDGWCLRLNV